MLIISKWLKLILPSEGKDDLSRSLSSFFSSKKLLNFVDKELLPGTKIKKENFWKGFSNIVHQLEPKNKELLEKRVLHRFTFMVNNDDEWVREQQNSF